MRNDTNVTGVGRHIDRCSYLADAHLLDEDGATCGARRERYQKETEPNAPRKRHQLTSVMPHRAWRIRTKANDPEEGAIYALQVGRSSAALHLLNNDVAVRQALLSRHLGATATVTTTVGIDTRAVIVAPIVTITIVIYANPHAALADRNPDILSRSGYRNEQHTCCNKANQKLRHLVFFSIGITPNGPRAL